MWIYVVQSGDSVNTIADRYGVSLDALIYNNQLEYPYRLAVGQALLMPGGNENTNRRTIVSNGYAYPFISPWVLEQTLPYLTEIAIFSYGFTGQGELVPPVMDDTWVIRAAVEFETLPILTLTPFGPDGQFNNNLITAVVNNPSAEQQLFQNLRIVMQEKGYQGLDIDFEYILAEDRDAFTRFVQNAVKFFNALGYQVSVALAPKTSSDQVGLLYEGKDYPALGAAANRVLLMTYEWGYTYGPPMAVAPLNMVRRVVEYAVTEIPPQKIKLGIPNYGYDWPLPYERRVTRARTIGNIEAVQIAIEHGVNIQFDEVAQSPFFRYTEAGIEHEVWFEDVRSIRAKFGLIQEFGLVGTGYWQLMQLFRANWLLMADTFWIR